MNHPDQTELSDFILGKLVPPQSDFVEEHLSDCTRCQETLLNLSGDEDTFVGLLRGDSAIDIDSSDRSLCEDGPTMLRDYQLVERLAQGGMGTVYRAKHVKLGRMVAVKVLPASRMKDQESIARFQREMQAAGALDHPNIVRAYDAGEVDEKHFLAMELIDGIDLSRLAGALGHLEVSDACEIIRQAAVGLEHAHQHGLVHRDIKPSNLMITRSTPVMVKVLDLGLARMLSRLDDEALTGDQPASEQTDHAAEPTFSSETPAHRNHPLTTTDQLMGTPDYMSPEQCTNVRRVDVRSDVYSLGATLYKLLTGTAPHSSSRYQKLPDKIRGVTEDPPRPIADYRTDVPARLSQIIDRMLMKDPADRFASPGEVAQAIEPFTHGHRLERLVDLSEIAASDELAETRTLASRRVTVPSSVKWGGVVACVALLAFLTPWQTLGLMMGIGPGEKASPATDDSGTSGTGALEPGSGQGAVAMAFPAVPVKKEYLYFSSLLSEINFSGADIPGLDSQTRGRLYSGSNLERAVWTYALLDGPGEVFLSPPPRRGLSNAAVRLVARTADHRSITGRLVVPDEETGDLIEIPFTIEKDAWNADDRESFLETKRDHYSYLAQRNIPGSAWFRFQADSCQRQLNDQPQQLRFVRPQSTSSLDRTFELMSGARAIGENLQLERIVESDAESRKLVPVDEIPGITIDEFDWKELSRGKTPPLDPLASLIPADQHAFLFSSFAGLLSTVENAREDTIALITFAQLNLADRDTLERYRRQRGLPLNELVRVLGPQFIKSVAVTGSDPYFDDGTDFAILFEPTNTTVLSQLIEAQIALSAEQHQNVESVSGEIDGVSYSGYVNPRRTLCSYHATVGGTVVVTNSLVQLRRLVDVAQGRQDSLSSLEEYHFFRQRYPIDDDQSGLVVLTDPTIRRWCGPRWRIGASRRAYAAAALAAVHAEYVVAPTLEGRPIEPKQIDDYADVAGRIIVDEQGVRSETFGTLDFLTPIAELDLNQVSEAESAGYRRWRERYEQRWRLFDPIAIQFKATEETWLADVTVMPLARRSGYDLLVELTAGAEINPGAIDDHPQSLIHFSMSIDKQSTLMSMARTALEPRLPPPLRTDPFGWMGSTIEVFVDEDPVWKELPLGQFDLSDAVERELPLVIGFEVVDGIRLIPFLAALRTFIEQVAPDMTVWETRQHNDVSYTRISANPNIARDSNPAGILGSRAIYYVISGDKLYFSFNEPCLQRAIDRAVQRRGGVADNQPPDQSPGGAKSPLGKNISLDLRGNFQLPMQMMMSGTNFLSVLRRTSTDNLPILNEWKRRLPESDPVDVHLRFWGRRLICRGGGQYIWNEEFQTMESSVFGSLGTRIPEDYQLPIPLRDVDSIRFGVTFEHEGLRARMEMRRK